MVRLPTIKGGVYEDKKELPKGSVIDGWS